MKQAIEWTQDMVDYLLSHQELSGDEMGRRLGMSHATVNAKFREMGIHRPKNRRGYEWTPEKDDYLREHYPDEAASDIAEHLGTCYGVVKARADLLGIRKSDGFSTRRFRNRWVRGYKHNIRKVA